MALTTYQDSFLKHLKESKPLQDKFLEIVRTNFKDPLAITYLSEPNIVPLGNSLNTTVVNLDGELFAALAEELFKRIRNETLHRS